MKAIKGFKDILPPEVFVWQHIERLARDIFHRYGFNEIKVPILEDTGLFARSIGETTDIVEKEMYTFTDRNGASVTMRPEGTAPVLRAFIEHNLHLAKPIQRLYTIGPMFRHERPQKGRLRQFHQISVEVLGSDHPGLDAETMSMAWLLLRELGLTVSLEINSLGCKQCRPAFNNALVGFLEERQDSLCEDCQRRRLKNPLRVLDCKSANCQEQYTDAPAITDYLCADCDSHFKAVQEGLEKLDIPHNINTFMVRGLDYYTRTTFELITGDLGAQSAVGAGGRYDGLVEQLGGPKNMPGIGFAMGIERLVLLLEQQGINSEDQGIDIFIAALGEQAQVKSFILAYQLRSRGLTVLMDYEGRSLKSQMKQAGRFLAGHTLILGDEELKKDEAILRDMDSGEQEPFPLSPEIETLAADLKKKIS